VIFCDWSLYWSNFTVIYFCKVVRQTNSMFVLGDSSVVFIWSQWSWFNTVVNRNTSLVAASPVSVYYATHSNFLGSMSFVVCLSIPVLDVAIPFAPKNGNKYSAILGIKHIELALKMEWICFYDDMWQHFALSFVCEYTTQQYLHGTVNQNKCCQAS
jgi:hypothetical protein